MALPLNTISTTPQIAPFLSPDTVQFNPLVSYERGGVDLQDTSEGNVNYIWRCKYFERGIYIEREPDKQYLIVDNLDDVISLDFTFDQNMNQAVCYEVGTTVYLRWFDTVPQTFVTTTFPFIRSPRLTMDDKRIEFNTTSDIIFAYIKQNGDLCYRQQRDRFTIERVLRTGIPEELVLEKIGMSANNRLYFNLSPQYLLPICTLPGGPV